MLHFLADENFNNHIIVGLLRRDPTIDIVRVQSVDLTGSTDDAVLEWAAENRRIILTHDVATMSGFAYQRQAAGLAMTGVFVIPWRLAYKIAIEDIVLLNACSEDSEWEERILYLPLRNFP